MFSLIAAGSVGAFQMLEDRGGEAVDNNASAIGALPEVQSLYDAQVEHGVLTTGVTTPPTTVASTVTTTAPSTTAAPVTTVPVVLTATISMVDVSTKLSWGTHPGVTVTLVDQDGNPMSGAEVVLSVPKSYAADGYQNKTIYLNSSGQKTYYRGIGYYTWEYPFNFSVVSVTYGGDDYTLSGTTTRAMTPL